MFWSFDIAFTKMGSQGFINILQVCHHPTETTRNPAPQELPRKMRLGPRRMWEIPVPKYKRSRACPVPNLPPAPQTTVLGLPGSAKHTRAPSALPPSAGIRVHQLPAQQGLTAVSAYNSAYEECGARCLERGGPPRALPTPWMQHRPSLGPQWYGAFLILTFTCRESPHTLMPAAGKELSVPIQQEVDRAGPAITPTNFSPSSTARGSTPPRQASNRELMHQLATVSMACATILTLAMWTGLP